MTDKVQKIREEVKRLQNELIQEKEKGYGSDVDDACILELQNVLTYIDFLQEEPVSEELEKVSDKCQKEHLWKSITEIPTEHWANNYALSPLYLVKCGEKNGIAILGYSYYSFATKSWMECYCATEPGIHKVTEWTDIKL